MRKMRHESRGLWLIAVIVLFFSAPVLAGPMISVSCAPCVASDSVVSIPIGAQVVFQATDSERPIQEVVWRFGDGAKTYGLTASHIYRLPGRYKVEALVIYDTETLPASATINTHVVVAPVASETLFGLPTSIVYPVLSALAMVILYWLTGTIPA